MNSLQRLFEDAEYFCLKLHILLSATYVCVSSRVGPWPRADTFRVGCISRPTQLFFADSYGSAALFLLTTCFQHQKVSARLGNSTTGAL